MMDLVVLLKDRVVEEQYGFRLCAPIRIRDTEYTLSVQASDGHYCTPRKMAPLEEYTHFEIMTNLPVEDVPESWSVYGVVNDVFGWVPKQEIEDLLDVLYLK